MTGMSNDAATATSSMYGEALVNPISVNEAMRQYVVRNRAIAR